MTKTTLVGKIVADHINGLRETISENNRLLSDDSWASTKSDFHKSQRQELLEETSKLSKELQILTDQPTGQ